MIRALAKVDKLALWYGLVVAWGTSIMLAHQTRSTREQVAHLEAREQWLILGFCKEGG